MLDAIRNRRSIRRYQERPIGPDVIEQLQESVLYAPSSRNLRPCRFVFVTDRALLESLAHAKASFGDFLGDAGLGVVICGNPTISDCCIEDGSIAAATLQLAAIELGLGSCWIQIRARQHSDGRPAQEHVREILGLPEGLEVLCIISIGYPAEDKAPRSSSTLGWESIEAR